VPLRYLCPYLKKEMWKMDNMKRKKLTVLLVDDEDMLREALFRQPFHIVPLFIHRNVFTAQSPVISGQ